MSTPNQTTPEILLAHSDWMRDLVVRLVYEPSHAEDVLQETWLIAMQRAPQDLVDPRAWLTKVAQNVSRNFGRGEKRRRLREQAAARLEAMPDTVDVIKRAHLHTQMVEAVLGLDEPYRTTVLLRFFEGLPPAEIAERLGRPVNTVRSQIGRGLALLRTKLDAKFGDRETWGMAFLPLFGAIKAPAVGGSQLINIGVGIMSMKWITALTAIVLGLFVWSQRADQGLDHDGLKPMAEVQADPAGEPSSKAQRSGALERTGAAPPSADATKAIVEITFLDPVSGEPAAGIPWWVMRTGIFDNSRDWDEKNTPTPLFQGISDSEGIARFLAPEDVLVHLCTARTTLFARGSWPLRIDPSKPVRQHLTLSSGTTVLGRVVDEEGRPQTGIQIRRRDFFGVPQLVTVSDESGRFAAERMANFPRAFVFDDAGRVVETRTGTTKFSLSKPWVTWVRFSGTQFSELLPASAEEGTVFDAGNFVMKRGHMLTGTVVDNNGSPVAGALISLNRLNEIEGGKGKQSLPLPWQEGGKLSRAETLTDGEGKFVIEILRYSGLSRKLTAFAQGMSPTAALIPSPEPDGTRAPLHITLAAERLFRLHLVDPQEPDGTLWLFDKQAPQLLLRPNLPDSEAGGRLKELPIPDNGELLITRSILQADRASTTLILDGYEPVQVELDLSKPGKTVELERHPQIRVTVEVHGPGAAKTKQVDVLVCALPPLSVEEAAVSSLNGEPGTRSIGIMDYGQFDYLLEGAPVGERSDLPWPMAQKTWIYIRPTHRNGYEQMGVSTFGPFYRTADAVTCKLEVPAWVVKGSRAGDGEAAGLADKRVCRVNVRVVSAETDDPIEEAGFVRFYAGKFRSMEISNSEGTLVAKISKDEADCRISHPFYHPAFLGPLNANHGGSIDLGEVALEPLELVHCQLVDLAGNPLQERRTIHWDDSELGERWAQSSKDGRFVLGMSSAPPTWIRVGNPDSPRRIWARVEPVNSKPDTEINESNPMICRIPPNMEVLFEIHGLDAHVRNIFAPIFLVGQDGARARIWSTKVRDGVALFNTSLPPGSYTLVSGWAIAIPPTAVEITSGPQQEPIVIKVQGQPVVR